MCGKNYVISAIIGVVVILALAAIGMSKNPQTESNANTPKGNNIEVAAVKADKIEVVHFHATQQCWSCITVGEYALKTIQEKFPEEYKNGTIVYKDINGELAENRDMVMKYKASGSSLFVNAITEGKDNIGEDTTVWRLVSNESQYISYFQDKLNKLLGK